MQFYAYHYIDNIQDNDQFDISIDSNHLHLQNNSNGFTQSNIFLNSNENIVVNDIDDATTANIQVNPNDNITLPTFSDIQVDINTFPTPPQQSISNSNDITTINDNHWDKNLNPYFSCCSSTRDFE